MTAIRVLLCDDHELVRTELRRLLDSARGIDVVAEAGSADAAVKAARLEQPGVVLIDISMPARGGIEATPDILAAAPETKVVVLSMYDDVDHVHEAFAAGASGYVLKDAAAAELAGAVREVAAGSRYLSPGLLAKTMIA